MATINQIEVNGTTYDINATELSSPATIDGISFDGSESVTRYAACATAAATAAKTAEIGADFTLEPGASASAQARSAARMPVCSSRRIRIYSSAL